MTWKPTDHVDEQVRGWMRARRWEVTATDYHFDQEIYSWRHQQPGGKSPTLRIARNVLEHNPAFVILYHLDNTLAEFNALIRVSPQVDPRLALLLQLGAELRLGQVVRMRRSDLDTIRRAFAVAPGGRKRGTTVARAKYQGETASA